jgi:hypothetical protein
MAARDQHSPLLCGAAPKASLACAVTALFAAPLVLRGRSSLRALTIEGLMGWPFKSLSAMDAEVEAR